MIVLKDLSDFSIENWYDNFKDVCMKSYLLPVPEALLQKLNSNETDYELEEVCSETFINAVKEVLKTLKNDAFVKNNWHAPMDAKFISFGNSLKVANLNDLMLYLTASEIMLSDFNNTYKSFYIVLRPWINIHPASEFRCIVINNVLRGISPRDWPTYYAHFKDEGPNIIESLTKFFNERIKGNFSRNYYTFDVISAFENDITLVDFGQLNSKSNLYAFSWKEIQPLINKDCPDEVAPVFRYLEKDLGIMTRSDAIKKFADSMNANS